MLETDFVLPVEREDLMDGSNSSYAVNYVSIDATCTEGIMDMLDDIAIQLKRDGALCISENSVFDTLYSIARVFSEMNPLCKRKYWAVLLSTLQNLCTYFTPLLSGNSGSNIQPGDSLSARNSLKMSMFLVNWILVVSEQDSISTMTTEAASSDSSSSTSVKESKKSSKKKGSGSEAQAFNWALMKEEALVSMALLLSMDLTRFWSMGCVEEEFVNLFSRSASQLMENPENFKQSQTRSSIFKILGILTQRYKHGIGLTATIIHMLPHFDHLSSHFAQLLYILATEYDSAKCVSDAIREIGKLNPADLSRDASGTKCFAAFIVELSELVPEYVQPVINVLLAHLDGEAYTMRNGVLAVLGNLVIALAQNKGEDVREQRDMMLDLLEERFHDVHAFVRSKVLQIWTVLCESKSIPLSRQRSIVSLAATRLYDKSSAVRKQSIVFLNALLRFNPFGSQLNFSVLQEQLDKERAKLRELDPEAFASDEVASGAAQDSAVEEATHLEGAQVNARSESKSTKSANSMRKKNISKASKQSHKAQSKGKGRNNRHGASSDSEDELEGNDASSDEEDKVSKKKIEVSEDEDANTEDKEEEEENDDDLLMDDSSKDSKAESEKSTEKTLGELHENDSAKNIDTLKSNPQQDEIQRIESINRQRVVVQYFRDAMLFTKQMQAALNIVVQLLGSKISSDVIESVAFIVVCYSFQVDGVVAATKRVLPLIFSKDKNIKDCALAAYCELFIIPEPTNHSSSNRGKASNSDASVPSANSITAAAALTARNLIDLTQGATLGELTCLEEMIQELMKAGHMSSLVLRILWDVFAQRIPNTTPQQSRGALLILGMLGGADPAMIRANVSQLVTIGLGERGHTDLLLARDTCIALQKLASVSLIKKDNNGIEGAKNEKEKKSETTSSSSSSSSSSSTTTTSSLPSRFAEPVRFATNHPLFEQLSNIITMKTEQSQVDDWIGAAEQAINTIYKLAEHPDLICGSAIFALTTRVFGSSKTVAANIKPDLNATTMSNISSLVSSGSPWECSSSELCKLVFVVGHVAIKQLVHMEAIESELKRRRAIMGEKVAASSNWTDRRKSSIFKSKSAESDSDSEQDNKDDNQDEEAKKNASKKRSASKKASKQGTATANATSQPSLEEDMGVAGASEDAETEYIHAICESKLIAGNNSLLAVFAPILARICLERKRFLLDPRLRSAAVLSLSKFMCVSGDFCDRHLQLLFTVLRNTQEATIRANIIIALGDLAFRFPNLVEPWTAHIYNRLSDCDDRVRKNTLMVLTHLILNDMVRVKGQISAMAMCVIDKDHRIADLAKLFFHELAKKGNALYNVMPDLVSRLSASTTASLILSQTASTQSHDMSQAAENDGDGTKKAHNVSFGEDVLESNCSNGVQSNASLNNETIIAQPMSGDDSIYPSSSSFDQGDDVAQPDSTGISAWQKSHGPHSVSSSLPAEASADAAASSAARSGLDEDSFKTIMEYLFAFIQKDRQSDALLDKLCHRFTTTRDPRQWRDIAYCLSYLSLSEKGIRRLSELFPVLQDKLYDDRVYECCTSLVNKARKFAKAEMKIVLDELQSRMDEHHKAGVVDFEASEKAAAAANKVGKVALKAIAMSVKFEDDDAPAAPAASEVTFTQEVPQSDTVQVKEPISTAKKSSSSSKAKSKSQTKSSSSRRRGAVARNESSDEEEQQDADDSAKVAFDKENNVKMQNSASASLSKKLTTRKPASTHRKRAVVESDEEELGLDIHA